MPSGTITVKYVNQPKAGKKKGTIKSADGQMFGVWANQLSEFTPDMIYEIEYSEEAWNGQTYRTISKATPKATAPASNGNGAKYNTYRETSPTDAERMFVCSLLNAAISAGKLPLTRDSIIDAVNNTRAAWMNTFGRNAERG
jgi:hypothetical protein